MKDIKWFLVPVCGMLALAALFLLVVHENTVSKQDITRSVYLGAWVGGLWDNQSKTINPIKLKEFERVIGRNVAIAHYYQGWDELDKSSVIDQLETISQNNWTPMISANPYFTDKCSPAVTGQNIYQVIAAGNCDQLITNIATTLKTYNKPVFFRFAWEMNIDSVQWGLQPAHASSQDFIAAWRHMHDIFLKVGAKNILWVFSVNIEKANSIPINTLYPGDDYVNWVGIDGYNWGPTQSWSHWMSFSQLFTNTYNEMTQIAPSKQLMISEFNSVSVGGDRAKWFSDVLMDQIPHNFPKVDAIIFFDENKTVQEGVDWNIQTPSNSATAVQNALRNPIYKSSIK